MDDLYNAANNDNDSYDGNVYDGGSILADDDDENDDDGDVEEDMKQCDGGGVVLTQRSHASESTHGSLEEVVSSIASQGIIANTPDKRVVSAAAIENIFSGPAFNRVSSSTA